MDEKIGNSDFTLKWLGEKIRGSRKASLKSGKMTKLGEHAGFLSEVFRAELEWSGEDYANLPAKVIVKIPGIENTVEATEDIFDIEGHPKHYLPTIHQAEIDFYQTFGAAPNFPIPLAKYFYGQLLTDEQPGIIVLEDLSSLGASVPLWNGASQAQVETFTKNLARYHAYCLAHPSMWEGKFKRRDPAFCNLLPQVLEGAQNGLADFIPPELFQKISPNFTVQAADKAVNMDLEFGIRPVLVHGDPWLSNLLFEKDQSSGNGFSDRLIAVIDWQEAHMGSQMEDLCRFLVSSCSAKFRRENSNQILEQYHATLHSSLHQFQSTYTVELKTLKDLYQSTLKYAMLFFTLEALMLCKSPAYAESQEKSGEILERLISAMADC